MDLETYQRSLYRLIVCDELLSDAPVYTQGLAGSSRLALVKEVVYFWRSYGLERFCIITAGWLKRLGRFETDVQHFVALEEFSPFIEEAGLQFLQYIKRDSDPVVAALASLEIALHETRVDLNEERIVDWPCDPKPILSTILNNNENDLLLVPGHYRVRVSRALPGGFVSELIENDY